MAIKQIVVSIIVLFTAVFAMHVTYANGLNPDINSNIEYNIETDSRKLKLQNLFKKHNSPLLLYSGYFIKEADRHHLDWRLVPAISGVESTFGKTIPYNSFNAYGWNNGKAKFIDWESSITTVSETISQKYVAKGAKSVEEIGKIYNPITPREWSKNVKYFINEIENTPPYIDEILSLRIDI